MKKEYIVGIDFGYEVTSAWIVPLFCNDSCSCGESLKLKATNMESKQSYYSAIYYNPNKGYSLDDWQGNIITGFKDKVSVLDQPQNAKKREAYTEYIKQIYARLLKHNTTLKVDNNGDTNFYLCIACPHTWNKDDRDAYIQFFNNTLSEFGIEVLLVISESEAICNSFFNIYEQLNKNILIVNYNPNEIDYIIINKGYKTYHSSNLGSDSVVESVLAKINENVDFRTILENTYSKLSELGCIDIITDVIPMLKRVIRKDIEHSVTYHKYPNLELNYNLIGEKTEYGQTDAFMAEKRKYRFEIDCNIDESIKSYKMYLENQINMLKQNLSIKNDTTIDNVIITGPDSYMPWMYEIVKNIFNTTPIGVDAFGNFAIAKGIALYAKQQIIKDDLHLTSDDMGGKTNGSKYKNVNYRHLDI